MNIFAVASSPGAAPGKVVVPFCGHTFPDPRLKLERTRARSKKTKITVNIEPCETCDLHREAEQAAHDYVDHLSVDSYRRKWDRIRLRVAQYASSHGGTDDCSEVYVLPHCAKQAVKKADVLAKELTEEEEAAASDATTQSITTDAPHPSEQLVETLKPCIRLSLFKPTKTSRPLTFATSADVNTAPNSYAHRHRDENSYRADRFYQRTRGPEEYEPGQWAAPSNGRLLNTSGSAIEGWGEEEDGELGDIEKRTRLRGTRR